jgi:hypothetical protein
MTQLASHDSTATSGCALGGAQWVDSGVVLGIVVVDSNRPSLQLVSGSARALLKQFVAAH